MKYIAIDHPLGGHQDHQVYIISKKDIKKLHKDESIIVYIFELDEFKDLKLNYPFDDYYNFDQINQPNFDEDEEFVTLKFVKGKKEYVIKYND